MRSVTHFTYLTHSFYYLYSLTHFVLSLISLPVLIHAFILIKYSLYSLNNSHDSLTLLRHLAASSLIHFSSLLTQSLCWITIIQTRLTHSFTLLSIYSLTLLTYTLVYLTHSLNSQITLPTDTHFAHSVILTFTHFTHPLDTLIHLTHSLSHFAYSLDSLIHVCHILTQFTLHSHSLYQSLTLLTNSLYSLTYFTH